jgi:BirA family biotin operon repressor/biotin-[acetyl-CoA-carboxylase] ligase
MDTHYASVTLESAESTQDEAAARFSGSPLLVVAAHQRHGRGRLDRTWVEPDRGLFTSLAFTPAWPAVRRPLIPLVAGLAMRRALDEAYGLIAGLRWPNDLMIGVDKVGGILVESTDERTIVGCGVNLWWPDPIAGAAGILAADPGPGTAEDLAALWATLFLERMSADPDYWGHHEYEGACVTVGQTVAFTGRGGTAVGIDDDGSLLVDTGGGVVAIHAGEIRVGTTLPDATEESS